jgi:hypothetical protein
MPHGLWDVRLGGDDQPVPVAERATDLLWTLNHPDTWYLLVHGCGWTADQYEQWVGDPLVAQLLVTGGSGG